MTDLLLGLSSMVPQAIILAVIVAASVGLWLRRQPLCAAAMFAAAAVQLLRVVLGTLSTVAFSRGWIDLGSMDIDAIRTVFLIRSFANTLLFTMQLALMLFAALYGRPVVRPE